MSVIVCCGHKRTSSSDYMIEPTTTECSEAVLSILDECPICGCKIAHLRRQVSIFDKKGNEIKTVKSIVKKNSKAEDLIEKLMPSVLYRIKRNLGQSAKGAWYLKYNDFGTVKKCYSNLSSCRLGLTDGFGKILGEKKTFC